MTVTSLTVLQSNGKSVALRVEWVNAKGVAQVREEARGPNSPFMRRLLNAAADAGIRATYAAI